jgi:hypothetical protein
LQVPPTVSAAIRYDYATALGRSRRCEKLYGKFQTTAAGRLPLEKDTAAPALLDLAGRTL